MSDVFFQLVGDVAFVEGHGVADLYEAIADAIVQLRASAPSGEADGALRVYLGFADGGAERPQNDENLPEEVPALIRPGDHTR